MTFDDFGAIDFFTPKPSNSTMPDIQQSLLPIFDLQKQCGLLLRSVDFCYKVWTYAAMRKNSTSFVCEFTDYSLLLWTNNYAFRLYEMSLFQQCSTQFGRHPTNNSFTLLNY